VDRAPGTYYHSLSVANLACAAAEAVKADVLLTRVAAYYHDVGKLMEPEYFIENQNGRNPHDGLDPAASYEIVKAHTKDGVEIVTEYRFPHVVIDLIAEHHGTTVMEVFFSKAQQNHSDSYCSRDFFRYDGPKPSRVESAILMIADVVEAMARVASTHHPSKVREMVHKVIVRKFDDGQFDRCALHTHTLSQIESAITQTLLGFLHKRIEYPEGEAGRAKALEG
jgi:putative nucleotidyltransferase with HDIG domain